MRVRETKPQPLTPNHCKQPKSTQTVSPWYEPGVCRRGESNRFRMLVVTPNRSVQVAKPLWHIDVKGHLQLSPEEFAHAEGLTERLDQVPNPKP